MGSLVCGLLGLVFPGEVRCCLCGRRLGDGEEGICGGCSRRLVGGAQAEGGWGRARWWFSRLYWAASYDGELREAVHAFKYGGRRRLGVGFGRVLGQAVLTHSRGERPDVVVPVPLHPRRLAERGFNQAGILAVEIGRVLATRVCSDNLRRVRYTPGQTTMAAGERGANVAGAFAVRNRQELRGKEVLLVDDVLTTGRTADECAKVLIENGARSVEVAVLAKAGVRPLRRAGG